MWIGDNPGDHNSYQNMRTILTRLGIDNGTQNGHEDHFHIDMRRPDRIGASQNLLSEETPITDTIESAPKGLDTDAAERLLSDILSYFNFDSGEVSMIFAADMPDMPPQQDTIVIAQEQQNQQIPNGIDAHIGACRLISTAPHFEYGKVVAPLGSARSYYSNIENLVIRASESERATILQAPQYGVLKPVSEDENNTGFYYIPDASDFSGADYATFLVEIGGKKVKVETRIMVAKSWPDFRGEEKTTSGGACPDGHYWKIHGTINENGTSSVNQIEKITSDETSADVSAKEIQLEALISTLRTDQYLFENIDLKFGSLQDGALGETTNNTITLDDNANGFGWYVDLTPGLNEEFLPTSDPYEWKAKPGSGAEGKGDLLTVLLEDIETYPIR